VALQPVARAARPVPAVATGAAAALVVAALVGAAPAWALVAAIALAAAVHSFRLVRLALAIHRYQHRFGPCRGAGFLGMGVLVGGVTVVTSRGGVAGVALTTTMYLLGLLLLPGAATTTVARLRRVLDGVALGTCLLYTAWLLAIAPHGGLDRTALLAWLVACTAASVAAVTGLRAAGGWRGRAARAGSCARRLPVGAAVLATVYRLIARPVPAEHLEAYLAEHRSPSL
jgi:hypothetical protein